MSKAIWAPSVKRSVQERCISLCLDNCLWTEKKILWRHFSACPFVRSKKEPRKQDVCQDPCTSWWVPSLETGGISAISLHFLFRTCLIYFFNLFFLPFGMHFKAISWQHDVFVECMVIFSIFPLHSEKADISQLDLKLGLDNDNLYKNLFSCGSFFCSHFYVQLRLCKNIVMTYAI